MDVFVICRDALCSKEINKEKLNLTTKFWLCFTFQQGQAPLCQLNLTQFITGFQSPPSRHPLLAPSCPHLFKIFVSPPQFSVPPPFKVF